MKVLVVGGVAAGTKTAAKLKRENRDADVLILTKGKDISYAGCGLPYYVGGLIESKEELIVNTPQKYTGLTGVAVETETEVTAIDPAQKKVTAKKLATGEIKTYEYDKLVISTGASPIVPGFQGKDLKGVFTMRTPDDAIGLRHYVQEENCKRAVVVGGGFIGLEIAENLKEQGLQVTVVDLAKQILPNIFDPEMAGLIQKQIAAQGIRVSTGVAVNGILGEEKATGIDTEIGKIVADVVVLSIGIKPNTAFLQDSGINMNRGTIVVNDKMETNLPDIYAAGDCAQVSNRITGAPQWSPMGSTANYSGRILAKVLTGKEKAYSGCMGTGVVKLPSVNAGRTGLTEAQAKDAGFSVETVVCVVDDKAHYFPGAGSFITKLIADKQTKQLLGIQVIGSAVDKMVDIAVTGIAMKAKLEDFECMDFAYAPPFSTAIHPFVHACHILMNKIAGELNSMTPAEYLAGKAKDYRVLDVQPMAKIPGATWINLATVNGVLEGIPQDEKLLLVCAKGKRGYFLQNRLKHYGYTNTLVLEGGVTVNDVKVTGVKSAISPEEVKRVKGLGCLQDKNYPDIFNIRVITRNGRITSAEHTTIAEAAEKFGSGAVTMTTRLTLEIQGVPFDQIENCRDYLAQNGLETGGTGSKVRPVVSCKGTTCQYGLIDTFALSDKIHERFYEGYHSINLPHKFKIAVGGCPNNCVKPNLNDLGIVGQKVPKFDLSKCRGCKVCQVVNKCPIKIAEQDENGKLAVDMEQCNHCGRCASACPFGCTEEYVNGYQVYIGGRWGKKVAHGQPLKEIFTTEEEVLDVVEKAILLFRNEGISGERFADTVSRLGFKYVEEKLLSNELLESKDKIIREKGSLAGGATC